MGTNREGLPKKVTKTSHAINWLFKELSPKTETIVEQNAFKFALGEHGGPELGPNYVLLH